MEREIKPALTPEEWAGILELEPYDARLEARQYAKAHVCAAVCLHGQPFGFTWEDVDMLRLKAAAHSYPYGPELRELADRIASLLPPREET